MKNIVTCRFRYQPRCSCDTVPMQLRYSPNGAVPMGVPMRLPVRRLSDIPAGAAPSEIINMVPIYREAEAQKSRLYAPAVPMRSAPAYFFLLFFFAMGSIN